MNLASFKKKIESKGYMTYRSQYNSFWEWKIGVEKDGKSHILDDEHRANACSRLLDILPGWQTWRGTECDYSSVFPVALSNISGDYDQIRQYSLLNFNQIPDKPLKAIWHELGRVKEKSGIGRIRGDYFIISICKPLMFLWGQTLAFDSKTRKTIRADHSLTLTTSIPRGSRWEFSQWKAIVNDFQRELSSKLEITQFLEQKAIEVFNSNLIVPYGRYLDIYYF
jgi:hypothetical protein